MEDDLQLGAETPGSTEGTQTPSLMDTLSEEFGFDDRGEAAGTTTAGASTPAATGTAPASTTPGATGAAGAAGAADLAAGAAPAAGGPGAAAAKLEDKPDPNAELYAPLPEHNPRKTVERFNKLVEGHKTVTAERDTAVAERDDFKTRIGQYEAGLQPLREMGFDTREAVADLQQFSQYRRALASGDVSTAMNLLQQQMQQLALASGKRVEVNPLSAFPDLLERVRVGEIDEQTGLELARSRHGQSVQHHHQQQQRVAVDHQQRTQEAARAGAQAVNETVVELMKSPDYAAVEPELLKQLPAIKANYAPHQWAGEIKRTYDYERRLLVASQVQQQQARPVPLRGNGHAGGAPAPKSAADAAMQALGMS